MKRNDQATAETLIYAYFEPQLTNKVKSLIAWARQDLYNGPHATKGYPGFTKACALISEAIEITDLWVDTDCDYITDSEPNWEGSAEDDESIGENPESWIYLEARDVKRMLFGKELAQYL